MSARSRKHYRRIWNAHINDLTTLAFAAGCGAQEHNEVITTLRSWVDRATARQDLPDTDERSESIEAERAER